MKQRTRPSGRGLFNRRGKPRRIEFLSCPAGQAGPGKKCRNRTRSGGRSL